MKFSEMVYFDYAASTPVDPLVVEAMAPYFSNHYGNPSSVHYLGQRSEAAVQQSRESVAHLINSKPSEIVFTSCGTESDNLAVRGTAIAARDSRDAKHILVTPVEHHAVLRTAQQLRDYFGFEVELLPTDKFGMVDPDDVTRRLRKDTAIVSVIFGNNEIGSINPIPEIGIICRQAGIPFHTDAVQVGAYLPLDVKTLNVDLLSLGAHKFYGPKGVGVLYKRDGVRLIPTQSGGGQEGGIRAGTHNVPYIVGFSEALRLAQGRYKELSDHLQPLRDQIIQHILETIPDTALTGHPIQRLPNHASLVFRGVDGNHLLTLLDVAGYACSSGSACKTGSPEPSEVLTAIGFESEWALGSLRVTLGRKSTQSQVNRFLNLLPGVIQKARQHSNGS